MRENVGAPTLADRNISVVRMSYASTSLVPISKKFEFCGLRPLAVKLNAIFVPSAPVFLIVKNLVTYPNLIFWTSPISNFDDERNGIAET